MFFSFHHTNIKCLLETYFKPKSYLLKPMSVQLSQITGWVTNYNHDDKKEVNAIVKLVAKQLQKVVNAKKQNKENPHWLLALKSMMLIQQLLCIGVKGCRFQGLLEKIGQALGVINNTNQKILMKLQQKQKAKPIYMDFKEQILKAKFSSQVIYSKLLQPYYHYLLKRCQLIPKEVSAQNKVYYLINLMSKACDCTKVIYVMARYRQFDEFFVVGEFNRVMAKDCSMLYGVLRQEISIRHNKGKICGEIRENDEIRCSNSKLVQIQRNIKQKVPLSLVDDLLLPLHQKLFHIFYNKYNYKVLQPYLPNFIDLDSIPHKPSNLLNLNKTPSKSLQQTAVSLNFSQTFGTKNLMSDFLEQSLHVISEMEKLVEMCGDV